MRQFYVAHIPAENKFVRLVLIHFFVLFISESQVIAKDCNSYLVWELEIAESDYITKIQIQINTVISWKWYKNNHDMSKKNALHGYLLIVYVSR